jgi:prevent-host-death family protein
MTASEARQHFAGSINRVARNEARVIVEKNGVPVAAIVPMEDLRQLERVEAEQREIEEVLDAMSKPFEGIPAEEVERQTERILEEMKVEDRRLRRSAAAGQ